ncbi:MAG: transglutaminaseTgpA domain-containing protein [Opitutaceae bacterium]
MLMRKRQVKLTVEELLQLKWLMGSFLSLLGLWSLGSLEMQSGLLIAVVSVGVLVALVKPSLARRIPQRYWRPIGFILLLVVGADFLVNLPEFMPPLLRMVVLLMLYRTFAPRRRREDLQIVLLCLFCLVISGVLTVSLLFAFQILLFTPFAMGLLFLICLLDRGKESRSHEASWQTYHFWKLTKRLATVLDYRVLALGALMFSFVVAFSTLLFVLTPRFDLHQAIPYLQIKSESRAGFSENVKLGEVSEIQSNSAVAMRVDVPSLDAIDGTPYWRILTLDKYDKGFFRMSKELKGRAFRSYPKTRELMGRDLLAGRDLPRRSTDIWTIYLEGGTSQFLPIPGAFHAMRFEGVQELTTIRGLHHLGLLAVQQKVFSYQIEDMAWTHRFPAMRREVRAFANTSIQSESAELSYPLTTLELSMSDEDRAYLTELNVQIKGESEPQDVAAYSQLLTGYLWDNYRYSLSPDSGHGADDEIVKWLRGAEAGHCEYFAGAFSLLARDAGYPTRMVVGFTGGAWNVVEEYFVVRNDDAHAWVEIYDQETEEWLRVDPTPGSGSIDPDSPIPNMQRFEAGWGAWIDSLRIQWYRRIVNFDQNDQIDIAISAKDIADEMLKSVKDRINDISEKLSEMWKRPFSSSSTFFVVGLVAFGLLAWGFWHARYYLIGLLYRLLRRPKTLDPLRLQASRYLRKLKTKEIEGAIRLELQAVRFGPVSTPAEAKVVFREARKVLKGKASKDSSKS